jgi:hypothetical protein
MDQRYLAASSVEKQGPEILFYLKKNVYHKHLPASLIAKHFLNTLYKYLIAKHG